MGLINCTSLSNKSLITCCNVHFTDDLFNLWIIYLLNDIFKSLWRK